MSWRKKLINLKKIAQKLKTWECRIEKHIKKPLWRHQIKILKIWEKCHLKFCLTSWGPSFIKIGQELWKWEAVTDRHTHTHTDAQTGSPWVNIFSPEMTEYKKMRLALKVVILIYFLSMYYTFVCCVKLLTTVSIKYEKRILINQNVLHWQAAKLNAHDVHVFWLICLQTLSNTQVWFDFYVML